jgi:glycosyltransferase involved in cell wall biosynthesis
VLFLTESFHPVLGGGEQHIRGLAAGLAASGLPATVLTRRSEAASASEESLEGVRVLRVPPSGPGRLGKYRMLPAALGRLLSRAELFDVIVVRGSRVLGLPGLLAGRFKGKPVVLQPELNGELSGEVYWWGTPLDREPARLAIRALVALRNGLLRDADAFVAMSQSIRQELLAAGVVAEKIHHVAHGVDTARFRPAAPGEKGELRRRLGLPADAMLLVYTGRLLRGKGLEGLLAAFEDLSRGRPELQLLIVGSGLGQSLSVEDDLKRSVAARGLETRVTFSGRVDNVEEYLRAADVFAFPSVFEALGISLIEAAATGLPAVGARTGGIVDVIEDGRSGVLFAPGDVAGLSAALARLVDDASLRQRLGARARQVVLERFDERVSRERYRTLFIELHAASRGEGQPSTLDRP